MGAPRDENHPNALTLALLNLCATLEQKAQRLERLVRELKKEEARDAVEP